MAAHATQVTALLAEAWLQSEPRCPQDFLSTVSCMEECDTRAEASIPLAEYQNVARAWHCSALFGSTSRTCAVLLESLLAGLLKVTFNYAQFKEVYDKGDSFFINWCENTSIANNASECIESVNASFGTNLVSMDIWQQSSLQSAGARGGRVAHAI